MISIVAVAYHSKDWENILRDSVAKKTKGEHELIIIDNSQVNRGHGAGLNEGIKRAKYPYILVLDIDAHILLQDWDEKLLKSFEGVDIMAGEGSLLKPMRPCVAFFKKQWFLDNKFSFTYRVVDGLTLDVGIHMFMKSLQMGCKHKFFSYAKTQYKDVWGNDFLLDGEPFVYHNWYGTRWYPNHQIIDGRKHSDFLIAKDSLLKQYGV